MLRRSVAGGTSMAYHPATKETILFPLNYDTKDGKSNHLHEVFKVFAQ
jgi:hypothetical protein